MTADQEAYGEEPLTVAAMILKHPALENASVEELIAKGVRYGRREIEACEVCNGRGFVIHYPEAPDLAGTDVECPQCAGTGLGFD